MKSGSIVLSFLLLFLSNGRLESQGPVTPTGDSGLRVLLLGTAGGPRSRAQDLVSVRWFWQDLRSSWWIAAVG